VAKAKNATERSRARRYRARLSSLKTSEKAWLKKYDRDVSAKPKKSGAWTDKKIAHRLIAEIASVLRAAGVPVGRPIVTRNATGYVATVVSSSLLAVRSGEDSRYGPALDADWTTLGRGSADAKKLARLLGNRGVHVFNLKSELSFRRTGSADRAWISVMALTTLDNARLAIPRRLRELADIPSDIRIRVHAWQIDLRRLPRRREVAGDRARAEMRAEKALAKLAAKPRTRKPRK